jgi:hypothetical protein
MPTPESGPVLPPGTGLACGRAAGKLGAAVFQTKDCRKTYAQLKARGVVFKSEPSERFYGIEAIFQDDSGNCFSLTERK